MYLASLADEISNCLSFISAKNNEESAHAFEPTTEYYLDIKQKQNRSEQVCKYRK
jgi:hypothetical protein